MNTRRTFLTAAIALVATFALPATASDFPKGSPKFETSYREALAASQKSGKPIVVVFSASWCPPCQQMKKKVYPSAAVTPLHDNFIWAYLDTDDEVNAKAAAQYKVAGIPHIEFLGKDGKSLGSKVGFAEPGEFAKILEGVLKKAGAASPAPAKAGA